MRPTPPTSARPESKQEHRPAILLVEDNMTDVHLVLRRLRGQKYDVRHVRTGAGALRLLEQEEFKAVLLDHRLPDIPGTKVCRFIRETDPDIPVLLFSSLADEALADAAFRAGATDYLVKDSAMRYLSRLVNQYVTVP